MDELRKALAELVRLKRLKEKIEARRALMPNLMVREQVELHDWIEHYERCRPLAWQAACSALAAPQPDDKEHLHTEDCGVCALSEQPQHDYAQTVEYAKRMGLPTDSRPDDKRDAERYRWIRDTNCRDNREPVIDREDPQIQALYAFIDARAPRAADAAIDAALQQGSGKEGETNGNG